MYKFLSFTLVMLFSGAFFIAHAQHVTINRNDAVDFLPKKTKTLSIQTQSGGGAGDGRGCWTFIIAPKKYLCLNDAGIILRDSSSDTQTGYANWYYNDNFYSSDITITVTKPGIYKLESYDGGGHCWDEVFVTSTIPIDLPASTNFCTGGTVVLQAPANSADSSINVSFQWYNGNEQLDAANSTYTASETGNYHVQTVSANGCIMNSDVINVNVATPPQPLSIKGDNCSIGAKLFIDSIKTAIVPDSITWYRNNINTVVSTSGNTGTVVAGGNGRGNALNQLNKPYGIFIDANKNIYIADHDNNRIVKWAPGAEEGEIIDNAIITNSIYKPFDVWADNRQNLFIADNYDVLAASLKDSIFIKNIDTYNPAVITGGPDSSIYICKDSTIEKWNPYNNADTTIGSGQLNNPIGIFVDSANNIYVVDELPGYYSRVVKFTPDGTDSVLIDGIYATGGIVVDKAGNIYITADENVQLWTPGAVNYIEVINDINDRYNHSVTNNYNNEYNSGIGIDHDGNLYIGVTNYVYYGSQGFETTMGWVYKFAATDLDSLINNPQNYQDNIVPTIVAGGTYDYSTGSTLDLSQIGHPGGIFIDSAQNIYIADWDNGRIVKWAPGATSGSLFINSHITSGSPNTLWLNENQDVFYSSSGSNNIVKVHLPFSSKLLNNSNSLGITGDGDSNIYTSSGIKWNFNTDEKSFFGAGLIQEPNGIYMDSLQNIYIGDNLVDSENNYYGRILKLSSGNLLGSAVAGSNYSQIGAAGGLAMDNEGNIFIADINNNRVLVWKKDAPAPTTIASGYMPWGIKLDNEGNIYVSDLTNNRVVMYPPMIKNSITTTSAGIYFAQVSFPGGCTVNTDSIVVSNNCSLPLELLSFTGKQKGADILLNWQTAQEINIEYFEIERSTDGIHYSVTGSVAAYNSNMVNNYSYVDRNIPVNTNELYYRLKEVDKDGTFLYSKVVVITIDDPIQNLRLSPNPAHDLLTVHLTKVTQPTSIVVVDVNGRRLIKKNIPVGSVEIISLNISHLAAGTYFLQVLNNVKTEQQKFVKY